jgi:hypothetical protein
VATVSAMTDKTWRSFTCRICGKAFTTDRENDPDDPETCAMCALRDVQDDEWGGD